MKLSHLGLFVATSLPFVASLPQRFTPTISPSRINITTSPNRDTFVAPGKRTKRQDLIGNLGDDVSGDPYRNDKWIEKVEIEFHPEKDFTGHEALGMNVIPVTPIPLNKCCAYYASGLEEIGSLKIGRKLWQRGLFGKTKDFAPFQGTCHFYASGVEDCKTNGDTKDRAHVTLSGEIADVNEYIDGLGSFYCTNIANSGNE
ncbi:uncharacterized protein K452DRAFT_300526 [Aplosporella prunicola CBS 121167]|uniref:Ecp2 effector protein domain-containing protein n=1 Tax=Aplosporella prunicola CBS 121167 TaxID=1176127 RepID=A0A6A6B3Y3_9PEZI|nr:uncharacterized protein K452DRAFT_300526 [Aplosporella prunicola CBS 121167]KAF2138929.1 hypothetical protein K452DRAFT_300526 [Aplosporella prunicola CBS 121167]